MYTLVPMILGIVLAIIMLHSRVRLTVDDLPSLFSDEPEGAVEYRPDLALVRNADECYRICLLRSYITYAVQRRGRECAELFEVTYRGKPGPVLELENEWPSRFGLEHSSEQKVIFSLREQKNIRSFAHTIRVLVSRNRASE